MSSAGGAIVRWRAQRGCDRTLEPIVVVPDQAGIDAGLALSAGAVEIAENDTYAPSVPASIAVTANAQLEVRAADRNRPLLELSGDLTVSGGDEAALTINGLVLVGGALVITGNLRQLNLRHCTLVPGLASHSASSEMSSGGAERSSFSLSTEASSALARSLKASPSP